jgi:hypothetical protein
VRYLKGFGYNDLAGGASVIDSLKKLLKKIFGTPPNHPDEKENQEVVEAPEFDITQYAKKLGVSVGVLLGAVIAALKAAGVEEVTQPAVLVGALGVVAAGAIGTSFVMAIDLAARAFLSGEGSAAKKQKKKTDDGAALDNGDNGGGPSGGDLIPAPPGTVVWLQGETDPRPVLAMSGDGKKVSSYLVAAGTTVERSVGKKLVQAIDGTPQWHRAEDIRAIRPAKWP